MRIGLFLASVNPFATPELIAAFARGAEEGAESQADPGEPEREALGAVDDDRMHAWSYCKRRARSRRPLRPENGGVGARAWQERHVRWAASDTICVGACGTLVLFRPPRRH